MGKILTLQSRTFGALTSMNMLTDAFTDKTISRKVLLRLLSHARPMAAQIDRLVMEEPSGFGRKEPALPNSTHPTVHPPTREPFLVAMNFKADLHE